MIFLSTDCYHHQNKKIEVVLNQHALIGKTTYLLILELADQVSQMDQVSQFLYCITISC